MKKKKVKLAEVLWDAANVHLSPNNGWDYDGRVDYFSCVAAQFACEAATLHMNAAQQFLNSLGCPTDSSGQFDSYKHGEQRQGIRYMWLLLAMHVAEDEGIEVEVNQ